MEGEDGGAGGHERLEVALGLDHHQMHVDGFVGEPPQRRDHVGTEREVRHETPVHHVHMQPVGAPPPPSTCSPCSPRRVRSADRTLAAMRIPPPPPFVIMGSGPRRCPRPCRVRPRCPPPAPAPRLSRGPRRASGAGSRPPGRGRGATRPPTPATSGTGILGGPSLDTRVTRSPAGALTPGGGSCHTIVPWGAVGCGSLPPSCSWRPAFRSWSDASCSDRPNTRGTTPCPCNSGAGNKSRYAVR